MIPVEQLQVSPPRGDCLRACVASILELPVHKVPNYHGQNWWEKWLAWAERRGFTIIWNEPAEPFPGWWIAGVKSPRGDFDHAVVMRGAELVWDPHPEREPVGPPHDSMVLVPLDPARALRGEEKP